jgi:K+-sensing histidine kinase KdpD
LVGQSDFRTEFKTFLEVNPFLKEILVNITQVVWIQDITTDRILYVSPAFESVWRRSCDSLYADPQLLITCVHPEDRVQVMNSKARNNHKPYNQTYRIVHPDDSITWIYSRSFLINDPVQKNEYLFCIADNISDKKEVESALRRTLDRIREQFDLSRKMNLARKPEAVLRTLVSAREMRPAQRAALLLFDDAKNGSVIGDETITSWTSNLVNSTWAGESNLYEEPGLRDLFHASKTVVVQDVQTDPRLTRSVRDILLEGKVTTLAIFPLTALGEWRGCLMVFYSAEHQFEHFELRHLKVLVDQASITLHNLELLQKEEESRREAERANKIKTEFLAMISHELRTPLTSILGFLQTLQAEDVSWKASEEHAFINTIQQEALRLQELIDHLLDLSRLEAGMLPITVEPHTLHEVIQDASPQLSMLTKGHTLTIHMADTLPAVNIDVKRIAQVLVNLVRNAATYSPKNTEISINAVVHREYVQINVKDQGPGISPGETRKVFKAFQRGLEVETGIIHGAGLGLAICKGLVEAHGGHIWIRRKSTPGTTVSFTLPIAHEHAFDHRQTKES